MGDSVGTIAEAAQCRAAHPCVAAASADVRQMATQQVRANSDVHAAPKYGKWRGGAFVNSLSECFPVRASNFA